MFGYLVRRVLAAVPVMGVVALFVFLLLRLTPGDPAAILAGDNATPERLERIRTSLGLNEPLYVQFFTWIDRLLHGDLGVSLISNVPVMHMISNRIEPTISIALSTIVVSILIAVPLGVIAAWDCRPACASATCASSCPRTRHSSPIRRCIAMSASNRQHNRSS